jgi:hypothetical protein
MENGEIVIDLCLAQLGRSAVLMVMDEIWVSTAHSRCLWRGCWVCTCSSK